MMDQKTGRHGQLTDQMCGPIAEKFPSAQKVRMNHDIYMGKHLALYIQDRDQTTITET